MKICNSHILTSFIIISMGMFFNRIINDFIIRKTKNCFFLINKTKKNRVVFLKI